MEVKGISDLIEHLENGQLEVDLTDELQKVICAVSRQVENGLSKTAKGSLSLSLDIVNEQGVIYVMSKVKSNLPVLPRSKSIFYKNDDDNLTTENPNQLKMPFAEVRELPRAVTQA